MYSDPSGHTEKGDEKLSIDVQAVLIDLTAQWQAAKTQDEKNRIHNLANDYRTGTVKPTNQISVTSLQSDISAVLNNSKTSQAAKDIINSSVLGTFNKASSDAKNSIVSSMNAAVSNNRDQVVQAISLLDTLSVTANSLSTIQSQTSSLGSIPNPFTALNNYAQTKAYGQMVGIESFLLSNNVVRGNDTLTAALVNVMANGVPLDTRLVEKLKKLLLSVDSYNDIYEAEKDRKIKETSSALLDAIPGVSTGKALLEGISGKDILTNNGLNGWQRGLNIALSALDLKALKSLKSTWSLMDNLPEFLLKGEADNYVYFGMKDSERTYVGITNDVERRAAQHGARFEYLDPINRTNPLTRNQARAIEQVLIELNPQFTNKINSISKINPIYREATQWGREWLYAQGLIK